MAERALELDKVFAGYGETVVLEDIRFALDVGETVSIIGRNGVGKIDAARDHHGAHDAARRAPSGCTARISRSSRPIAA